MRATVLALLAFAIPALAAETGTIFGTVVLPEGGPAVRANIMIDRTSLAAQTDEQGRFRLEGVPAGAQSLRILASGHEGVKKVILVQVGDNPLGEIKAGAQKTRETVFVERPEPPSDTLDAKSFRVEFVPRSDEHKVFDPVQFSIRIYNRTGRPVLLLRARPEQGPKVEFKVAAPFDAFRVTPTNSGDAVERWETDFVEVKPGDWFDPYGGAEPMQITTGVPQRPGTYTALFTYSTTGPHLGLFAPASEADSLVARLRRVPAVDIKAKTDFKVDY